MRENEEILTKLDVLVKLTAAQVVNGKSFQEQVRLLNSVGLKPKEIADILGKSPNHISVALNYLKKKVKPGA